MISDIIYISDQIQIQRNSIFELFPLWIWTNGNSLCIPLMSVPSIRAWDDVISWGSKKPLRLCFWSLKLGLDSIAKVLFALSHTHLPWSVCFPLLCIKARSCPSLPWFLDFLEILRKEHPWWSCSFRAKFKHQRFPEWSWRGFRPNWWRTASEVWKEIFELLMGKIVRSIFHQNSTANFTIKLHYEVLGYGGPLKILGNFELLQSTNPPKQRRDKDVRSLRSVWNREGSSET